ncbi:hypothetical protein ENUP19_0284G0053 [Entamoeba nuttalli]|uniref:Transcriptional regulator cudA, putative n=2 Tax=Entamoeba nuttalli TaxID=412467 RepID=K2H5P7_ENTNP|nr:transcriptional regulator cudA, putative [Entamoeba nuttalli P19]EKE42938.1 transcriptional regulator cudA, putative [Entamoeba nuttalli P19]|eukprot:XP_008854725.1 transcriptional regulator cudA, putative [Entamoeba nuttalli P19]
MNNNIPLSVTQNNNLNEQIKSNQNNIPFDSHLITNVNNEVSPNITTSGDFIISYHHKLPHEERQMLDGTTKNVGVVIKQSAFLVVITSRTSSLENCSVDCTLLYDNPDMSAVHFINQKPITFNSQVSDHNSMNVELRILVLSSQHEDMLFRIKFDLYNSQREKIETLYSEPLRVISKADGGKKKVRITKSTTLFQTTPSRLSTQQTKPPRLPCSLKRDSPPLPKISQRELTESEKENIIQTLQYQQTILKELSQQSSTNPLTYPLVETLNIYLSLPQTQRIPQLLRFVSDLSPQESMVINELIQTYRDYKKSQ